MTEVSVGAPGGGQGLRPNLADFNSTPGGKDGRYLSTAERDQLLAASNVPL